MLQAVVKFVSFCYVFVFVGFESGVFCKIFVHCNELLNYEYNRIVKINAGIRKIDNENFEFLR